MKKYDVEITETLKKLVAVEAESMTEAMEKVEQDWNNGIHILDYEDFVNAEFDVRNGKALTMFALLVEPMKKPQLIEIHNELASLQGAVGGNIECLPLFDDPVVVICNEEGKLKGMPANRGILDKDGFLDDVICGPFLVVGENENGDFCNLSLEMVGKYEKYYGQPEEFFTLAGRLFARKIDTKKSEVQKSQPKKSDLDR